MCKPQPLINKTRIAIRVTGQPLLFLKVDVKSAFKFYKKYRYHYAMLRDNEKDAWENWIESDYFKIYRMCDSYKDWLFDYSFKDVI